MNRIVCFGFLAAMAAIGTLAAGGSSLAADREKIRTSFFYDRGAGGFDTVAYFQENRARRGKNAHTTNWADVTWRFSNADNLAKFEASPETYAPQYGGYDPISVAEGVLKPGNPKYWSVLEGRLYLHETMDKRDYWRADMRMYLAQADQNWPSVLTEDTIFPGIDLPRVPVPFFAPDKDLKKSTITQ